MGKRWQIGPWTVDEGLYQVSTDVESVHLRPKLFRLLMCLIEQYPNLVDANTLTKRVWGDKTSADNASVNHSVWHLRQILGTDDRCLDIIKNLPRVGYRLAIKPVLLPSNLAEEIERDTEKGAWSHSFKYNIVLDAGLTKLDVFEKVDD